MNMETSIQLRSGFYFDLTSPESSVFSVDDIAHGLSHLCRFTGHTRTFYSVAQHSVLVSMIVPPALAMLGLMHDAAEAIVGDVAQPLKALLPEYKAIEQRVERAVLQRLGLPHVMPPEIKTADLRMLATERRDLLPSCNFCWSILDGIEPVAQRIKPWPPERARRLFLARYDELAKQPCDSLHFLPATT